MKHNITYTKSFEISTGDLVNVICCAADIDYWGEICFDEDVYENTRKRLCEKVEHGSQTVICFEDVLVEILEHGGTLIIWDREEDTDHQLNLEQLLNGISKNASERGDIDPEDWDGESGDSIIQYAIFGDVIYG